MADGITSQFEELNAGENLYVGLGNSFMPSHEVAHLVQLVDSIDEFRQLIHGIKIEAIILHGTLLHAAPYVACLPDLPLAWYVWGFEAYDICQSFRRNLLDAKTKRITSKTHILDNLKETSRSIRWMLNGKTQRMKAVASRVKYCVSLYPEEFESFRQAGLLTDRTKWSQGIVIKLEDLVEGWTSAATEPTNIQLGNSGTPTNNHIEAIDRLATLSCENIDIVAPLSYGLRWYSDRVAEYGNAKLGAKFVPIKELMPLSEYNSRMSSCFAIMMNHRRQQGIGTLLGAMWRGAAVYLRDDGMHQGFTSFGLHVRSLQTELTDANLIRDRETMDIRRVTNQEILTDQFGWNRMRASTADLLTRLAS